MAVVLVHRLDAGWSVAPLHCYLHVLYSLQCMMCVLIAVHDVMCVTVKCSQSSYIPRVTNCWSTAVTNCWSFCYATVLHIDSPMCSPSISCLCLICATCTDCTPCYMHVMNHACIQCLHADSVTVDSSVGVQLPSFYVPFELLWTISP